MINVSKKTLRSRPAKPPQVGVWHQRVPARVSTQRGAVLIISLVILLLMTIIGITAMSTNSLEEKMAGNTRDLNLAFQAAESSLREAEATLAPPNPTLSSPCGAPPCTAVIANFVTQTDTWWTANGEEYGANGGLPTIPGVNQDPRYVIEALQSREDSRKQGSGPSTGLDFYRVTARGTGGTDAAEVILQTTFYRRY